MKKPELEDVVLEELMKLLEEETERLDEFVPGVGLGYAGRGVIGLGGRALRALRSPFARRGARQHVAAVERVAGQSAAAARAEADRVVRAAALGRQGVRQGLSPGAAARSAGLDHVSSLNLGSPGFVDRAIAGNLGVLAPQAATFLGRTGQRAVGTAALGVPVALGVGREGGIIPDIPGFVAGYSPEGNAQEIIDRVAGAAGTSTPTPAVTGGGGGGRSGSRGGGDETPAAEETGEATSTPKPGVTSTPTATPQTGPVQPVATGAPVGGKGGFMTGKGGAGPSAGKLAAAQSTWEATGGTGAVPGGTGPNRFYRMEVDPKAQRSGDAGPVSRPTNYDPREGELRGIFAENIEEMVLEELLEILQEVATANTPGFSPGGDDDKEEEGRLQATLSPADRGARRREISRPAPATPSSGQAAPARQYAIGLDPQADVARQEPGGGRQRSTTPGEGPGQRTAASFDFSDEPEFVSPTTARREKTAGAGRSGVAAKTAGAGRSGVAAKTAGAGRTRKGPGGQRGQQAQPQRSGGLRGAWAPGKRDELNEKKIAQYTMEELQRLLNEQSRADLPSQALGDPSAQDILDATGAALQNTPATQTVRGAGDLGPDDRRAVSRFRSAVEAERGTIDWSDPPEDLAGADLNMQIGYGRALAGEQGTIATEDTGEAVAIPAVDPEFRYQAPFETEGEAEGPRAPDDPRRPVNVPAEGGEVSPAAPDPREQETSDRSPRRSSRSRAEEPAEEPAAASLETQPRPGAKMTTKPGDSGGAATKGPGAATKGSGAAGTKGSGAGVTGPPIGKGAPGQATAAYDPEPDVPWGQLGGAETDARDAWSEREAARGQVKAAIASGRPSRGSGFMDEVREGQVHKTMATLKEGFAKYLPKK